MLLLISIDAKQQLVHKNKSLLHRLRGLHGILMVRCLMVGCREQTQREVNVGSVDLILLHFFSSIVSFFSAFVKTISRRSYGNCRG